MNAPETPIVKLSTAAAAENWRSWILILNAPETPIVKLSAAVAVEKCIFLE